MVFVGAQYDIIKIDSFYCEMGELYEFMKKKYFRIKNATSYKLHATRRSGQVMIITILVLGGAILSATTIAGLLMLYQIRQTTDIANSGKAIYAADAGIEWSLYNWFCTISGKGVCDVSKPSFSNRANFEVTALCTAFNGEPLVPCLPTSDPFAVTFRSVGTAGNSTRALGLSF